MISDKSNNFYPITGNISKVRIYVCVLILMALFTSSQRIRMKDQVIDSLKLYNKYFPMEKVFIHTDKFIYEPGEVIWFKGYILSDSYQSATILSQDLYIKLIDQQGEELIYRRYPNSSNTLSGSLALSRSLLEGKYYLVAYTSWMKNADSVPFFSKELVIVKNNKKKILADFWLLDKASCISDTLAAAVSVKNHTGEPVPGASVSYTIRSFDKNIKQGNVLTDSRGIAQLIDLVPVEKIQDAGYIKLYISSRDGNGRFVFPLPFVPRMANLQFHTPQGYLLRGIPNKLTFSILNRYGMPVCGEGEIISPSGKAISSFRSGASGSGTLWILPADTFYRARIIMPPGDSLYLLPPVRDKGVYINYSGMLNGKLVFNVKMMPGDLETQLTWILHSTGNYYKSEACYLTHDTLLQIPAIDIPEGLIQVSVFDHRKELIYDNLLPAINKTENLKIVTRNTVYGKCEKVTAEIILPAGIRLKGNLDLSVSVSPAHLFESVEKNDIMDCFLYDDRFPSGGSGTNHPDTSSFLLAGKPFPLDWAKIKERLDSGHDPYYNHDGITGIVYDKKRMPVGYAKVKAINISNWKSYETQCNESGIYRVLFSSDIIDFNYMNINAFDANGKLTLWPSVDQDFSKTVNNFFLKTEQDIVKQRIYDVYHYDNPDIISTFHYTEKGRKKTERVTGKISSPQQYINYASVLDIINDIKPVEIINSMIYLKGTSYTGSGQPGCLIIVDALPQGTQVNAIHNLTPPEIVYISFLTSAGDIKRYSPVGYQAVIEITTVRGIAAQNMMPALAGMDILELSRKFHSPDYSIGKPSKTDTRTTLYWNPSLTIPAEQKHSGFSFYTSHVTGIYVIRVEGFDEQGRPVSTETEFTVKE